LGKYLKLLFFDVKEGGLKGDGTGGAEGENFLKNGTVEGKVTFIGREADFLGVPSSGVIDRDGVDRRYGTTFIPYLAAQFLFGPSVRVTGTETVLNLGKMGGVAGFGEE
jgi:hypothetical protein